MQKQPNSHNCFICGVQNDASVKVRFYDSVKADGDSEVEAIFKGAEAHQGYPGRMHGGVAAGILDETIGRAINAGKGPDEPTIWGVAVELNVRYHKPVPLSVELRARGRITAHRKKVFEGSGEILLPDGQAAVSATARYVKLPLDSISETDAQRLGWQVYPDSDG